MYCFLSFSLFQINDRLSFNFEEGVLGGDEDNDDLNADDSTTEPTEVSSPASKFVELI